MVEEHKIKSGKIFYKEGVEQTIYFGEKSRKKNSYQLVRIYDKKADTKAKDKEFLYPGYEEYTDVTRLEVEIREDKAKFWTPEKLEDINYIFAVIVKTFYRYNYQFFGFLKFDDYLKIAKEDNTLYKERQAKIVKRQEHQLEYGSSFSNDEERRLWIATFITYGKRLLGDGYTPDRLLDILGV